MSDTDQGTGLRVESLKITLPTYDGVADPKIWLRPLEKIRKAKKWTKAHMVTQAPLLLTGRADDFWETVETDIGDDWDSFKPKIEEEFGEKKTEGEHLTDLTKLVREIDEPLPILLWRMEKKFKRAFPSADPDLSKKVLSERFKTALVEGKNKGDSDLGQHLKVHQADELDPKKLLKAAESLGKILGKQLPVNSLVTETDGIEKRITEQVIKSMAEIDMTSELGVQAVRRGVKFFKRGQRNRFASPSGRGLGQSSSARSQPNICFICHQPGHFRRTCQYRDSCYRCWKKGHFSRDCRAPTPVTLNSQWLGTADQH